MAAIEREDRHDVWHARLELEFAARAGATIPTHRSSFGPLRALKGLTPEGAQIWHQVIIHPPGGIAGGDALAIDVKARAGAHVLLTSPGATKWYRGGGRSARQSVALAVADDALIEWLPLESIFFCGADAQIDNRFMLAGRARLISAELSCLGRPAASERFDRGSVGWSTLVTFAGADAAQPPDPAFFEQAVLRGDDPVLRSHAGLDGHALFGTIFAAVPQWRTDAAATQAAVNALRALELPGEFAITALPGIVIGRWRGADADQGWTALRAGWACLRPLVAGRPAHWPRIWST